MHMVMHALGRPDRAPWGTSHPPSKYSRPPRLPPWRRQGVALALVDVPGHP